MNLDFAKPCILISKIINKRKIRNAEGLKRVIKVKIFWKSRCHVTHISSNNHAFLTFGVACGCGLCMKKCDKRACDVLLKLVKVAQSQNQFLF